MNIYDYANKILHNFKPIVKHETQLNNWYSNTVKQCIGIDEEGLQTYICAWEYKNNEYYKMLPNFYSNDILIKNKINDSIIKHKINKILLKKINKNISNYIIKYI
jgi:hypothetical protein